MNLPSKLLQYGSLNAGGQSCTAVTGEQSCEQNHRSHPSTHRHSRPSGHSSPLSQRSPGPTFSGLHPQSGRLGLRAASSRRRSFPVRIRCGYITETPSRCDLEINLSEVVEEQWHLTIGALDRFIAEIGGGAFPWGERLDDSTQVFVKSLFFERPVAAHTDISSKN